MKQQSKNVNDKATLDKLGIVKKYSTFIVQDGKRKKVEKKKIDIRFVGGCIREAFLGNKKSDIDFAVNCNPDFSSNILKQKKNIRTSTQTMQATNKHRATMTAPATWGYP